jgi:phosphatidylglycerophosphate synthase
VTLSSTANEDRILTVPNVLTVLRIFGTFPLFYFILMGDWTTAFWIFFAVAMTDKLDGLAATLLDQRTRLGRKLDPTVDYFMLGFIAVGVMVAGPWWFRGLVLVQLARMIVMSRMALRRRLSKLEDIAVSRDGKIAMVATCSNIAAFMLYYGGSDRLFLGIGIAFFVVWVYFGSSSLAGYSKNQQGLVRND